MNEQDPLPPRNRKPARVMLWAKIIALVLLLVYVIAFIVINSGNEAEVWLLPTVQEDLPVLWVIVLSVALTIIFDVIGRRLVHAARQLKRK